MNKKKLIILIGIILGIIFLPSMVGSIIETDLKFLAWFIGLVLMFVFCVGIIPLSYLFIVIYQWLTNKEVFDWDDYICELSDYWDIFIEWIEK